MKEDSGEGFNSKLLQNEDKDAMMFTIKNYGKGVSGSVHTAMDDRRFEVKGPLGKGLMVQPTGVHIAFAAGTGVLCFVDLVAALIRSTLDIKVPYGKPGAEAEKRLQVTETEQTQETGRFSCLEGNFKLYLYVSFPSRADSVALELLEALAEYCNRNGRKNFDLFVRLSAEGKNT